MNRIALFVIALLVWWAVALFNSAEGGQLWMTVSFVVFFYSFFAVPVVVYATLADIVARAYYPRHPALAFLALALSGFAAGAAYIRFGRGNNPFATMESAHNYIYGIGVPTLAVIALFTVVNLLSSPKASEQA